MRGRSRGCAAAASLEQADAHLYGTATASSGGRGADASSSSLSVAASTQQKLRYSLDPPVSPTSLAVSVADGDSSFVLPVLALLFCLSVCGFVFFSFLSFLFLGALDTLALPLSTKRAAGRASVAATIFHLVCLVGLGILLQKQHPEQVLRRFRAFIFDLGRRGGRTVLVYAGYMLRSGTHVARDCWLRITNPEGAATAAQAAHVSSPLRNRNTSDSIAATLSGGGTLLPYCSRNSGSNKPFGYKDAANTDSETVQTSMYLRGQRPPGQAVVLGSHASPSPSQFSSSLPLATAGGPIGFRREVECMSPSHKNDSKEQYSAGAGVHAIEHTAQMKGEGGEVSSSKTSSLFVASGKSSERTTYTRESSAGPGTWSQDPADARSHIGVMKNSLSDNLLLLMSPPTESQMQRQDAPPVVTLPPPTAVAAVTPHTAAAHGDLLGLGVNPDVVSLPLPFDASLNSTANPRTGSSMPGIQVEGEHHIYKTEPSLRLSYRPMNNNNNAASSHYITHRGLSASSDPVFQNDGAKTDIYLQNSIPTSGNCSSDASPRSLANKGGVSAQQQEVRAFHGRAPLQHQRVHASPPHEQAQQAHFPAGGQQQAFRQQQMTSSSEPHLAQQMLEHHLSQQQHMREQFSQESMQISSRENSRVAPTMTRQAQAGISWPPPRAPVVHIPGTDSLHAGQEVSGAVKGVGVDSYIRQPQDPAQTLGWQQVHWHFEGRRDKAQQHPQRSADNEQ